MVGIHVARFGSMRIGRCSNMNSYYTYIEGCAHRRAIGEGQRETCVGDLARSRRTRDWQVIYSTPSQSVNHIELSSHERLSNAMFDQVMWCWSLKAVVCCRFKNNESAVRELNRLVRMDPHAVCHIPDALKYLLNDMRVLECDAPEVRSQLNENYWRQSKIIFIDTFMIHYLF